MLKITILVRRATEASASRLNMRKRAPGNNEDAERRTRGWIGVDLDGTLAKSVAAQTGEEIGPPIHPMVELVKEWLAHGEDVRIFTARVNPNQGAFDAIRARRHIEAWCEQHLGQILPITCEKDWDMALLFDDRARQVEHDTGRVVGCPLRTDLKAHRNTNTRSRRRIEESPSAFNTGCKRRGSRRK
jgi:hypothetical protein